MIYSDTPEQCTHYLKLALQEMGARQIPVNPLNYAVWFEYVKGANIDLIATIDGLIEKRTDFTQELHIELYQNYITFSDITRGEKTLGEIRRVLVDITEYMTSRGGEMSEHGQRLEGFSRALQDEADSDSVRSAVLGVLSEARKMIMTGRDLEGRLVESTGEVDTLRSQLEDIRQQATTDALTGLANRLAFEAALSREATRTSATSGKLSLLFADIDHFKVFNDTFGHLVGDTVLRIVAAMIKGNIRENALAARYGGEEFVVVLPDTGLADAVMVAETIRSHIESKKFKRKDTGESIGAVTISIGATQYVPPEPIDAFIARADKALYQAKSDGRNRVVSAPPGCRKD